jgi:glycosyltransferase involved in cell wall biosynthesis
MKICFFNTACSWGGGEKWHFDMAQTLSNRGYECIIAGNPKSELLERAKNSGIPIYPIILNNLSFLNIFKINRIKSFFENQKIDAVILNLPNDLKTAGIAAKSAGLTKIVYRRGSPLPINDNALNSYLFRSVITDVIANSKETKRSILEKNPLLIAPERISVVYNGIDISKFEPAKSNRNNEVFTIGSAGRLSNEKNFESLLNIAKIIISKGYKIQLKIAGTGFLKDELITKAEALGIGGSVDFCGFVEDISAFMQSIDVFASTSQWEGFGYVRLEAMAAITPVIAYDISSASEIISHQRTGILVPFNDENKFADEIIDFIENPENRQTIAKNGKEFAEKFDIEKAVEKVIEILST